MDMARIFETKLLSQSWHQVSTSSRNLRLKIVLIVVQSLYKAMVWTLGSRCHPWAPVREQSMCRYMPVTLLRTFEPALLVPFRHYCTLEPGPWSHLSSVSVPVPEAPVDTCPSCTLMCTQFLHWPTQHETLACNPQVYALVCWFEDSL